MHVSCMNQPEQNNDTVWHQVGSFEAREAKQILDMLERKEIPFDVERDDSALRRPLRTVELSLAMAPEGAKLMIFVPSEKIEEVQVLVKTLFPV